MPARVNGRSLASNRPLLSLIAANAVSSTGDWLYLTALPVYIYQATGDAGLLGLVAVGRLIPFLALSLPAGILADRLSERTILIATGTVRALAMGLMTGLCLVSAPMAAIIVVAIAAAAAGTLAQPAQGSVLPRLARNDAELGRANGLYSTLDGIAGVAGPAIAGVLIVLGGLPLAFALNGASFALVAVVVAVVAPRTPRVRTGVDGSTRRGAIKDLRAIARTIRRQLVLDGAISFGAAALGVLPVVIAMETLSGDDALVGTLNAGAGIGGIAGGALVGFFVNRRGRAGILVGIAAAASAFVALSITTVAWLAIGLLAATVGSLIMLDALNMTAVQRLTAEAGTGRALGLLHTLAAVWLMAGALTTSALIMVAGVGTALFVTATVVLVLGLASVVTKPAAVWARTPLRPVPVAK